MRQAEIEAVGARHGRWTLVAEAPSQKKPSGRWVVRCDCGETKTLPLYTLRSGRSKSCGCWKRDRWTTHGGRSTPEYRAWMHMRDRCQNPNDKRYARYGGRGIMVCERWQTFENFIADVGPRPPGCTLDRINNDGHYEPGNVRWATNGQQVRNRSISKLTGLEAILLRQIWKRTTRSSRQAIARAFGVAYKTAHGTGTGRSHASALDDLWRPNTSGKAAAGMERGKL